MKAAGCWAGPFQTKVERTPSALAPSSSPCMFYALRPTPSPWPWPTGCCTGPKIQGSWHWVCLRVGCREQHATPWPGPGQGAESCLQDLSLHSSICPKLLHRLPKPELQGHQQLPGKSNSSQREREPQWQVPPQEEASLLGVPIKAQRLHFSYSNLHQRAERILSPIPVSTEMPIPAAATCVPWTPSDSYICTPYPTPHKLGSNNHAAANLRQVADSLPVHTRVYI